MDILGGILARLKGIPWIIREPSSPPSYSRSWKCQARIKVAAGVSAVVSNSRGGDEYWKVQLPHKRRIVVSNGLPVDDIEGIAGSLPPGLEIGEAPIALYVGRLASDNSGDKNLRVFLEALSRVRERQAVLGVVCGDGPGRLNLERIRHRQRMDTDVRFTGFLPKSTVWALMKKAAVFVSLSAYEGCPNAVMEAMACGCPLVLSNIPAHRELLDEAGAFFVNPDNIHQVVDAIAQVLNNARLSACRALNAKAKTEDWSVSEMARNYEKIYGILAASHSSSGAHGDEAR